MKVDVKFSNAKVYDINTFDVAKGEKFSLLSDYAGNSFWFSNNDPVLSMVQTGNSADIEATSIGSSVILIKDADLMASPLKVITVNVLDEIVDPASNLNVSGGTPVAK